MKEEYITDCENSFHDCNHCNKSLATSDDNRKLEEIHFSEEKKIPPTSLRNGLQRKIRILIKICSKRC